MYNVNNIYIYIYIYILLIVYIPTIVYVFNILSVYVNISGIHLYTGIARHPRDTHSGRV